MNEPVAQRPPDSPASVPDAVVNAPDLQQAIDSIQPSADNIPPGDNLPPPAALAPAIPGNPQSILDFNFDLFWNQSLQMCVLELNLSHEKT